MKSNHYTQRGRSLNTVTRIRLTLILVWIVLVLPGNLCCFFLNMLKVLMTTVTKIRLTLILVWIVLVLPGNKDYADHADFHPTSGLINVLMLA